MAWIDEIAQKSRVMMVWKMVAFLAILLIISIIAILQIAYGFSYCKQTCNELSLRMDNLSSLERAVWLNECDAEADNACALKSFCLWWDYPCTFQEKGRRLCNDIICGEAGT